MTKKKKKTKLGILKRKAVKKSKKQLKRKVLSAPKKKLSMKKVRKSLGEIALLIFQPEIEEIKISKEKIEKIYQKGEPIPLQVKEFIDEEIYQKFITAIQSMLEKISVEKQQLEAVTLQSTLHFMEQEKEKQYMNQLVVAKYYQLLSNYKLIEIEVSKENVLDLIQNYENEFASEFSKYEQQEAPFKEQAEQPIKKEVSELEKLYQQIKENLSSFVIKEKIELVLEDAETFFLDFLKQKNIEQKEKITPSLFQRFLLYAKQNLNPTEEDLENIIQSIHFLGEALYNLKVFDNSQLKQTKSIGLKESDK